jgi:predicted deacetylase
MATFTALCWSAASHAATELSRVGYPGMQPQYLLRFDDICPTMDWKAWEDIEPTLLEFGVLPVLAVIPDNQDDKLHFGRREENFWERVRTWQSRGWTIGMHGYQHRYLTQNPGLVGLSKPSEFAGVPLQEQHVMIRLAAAIFRQQGVQPQLWIAPGHTFDHNTIVVLKQLGIRIISDGYSLLPYLDDDDMLWIPQQLGKFRTVPFGVWTVCVHLEEYSHDPGMLRKMIERYRPYFTSVLEIRNRYGTRRKQWLDGSFELVMKRAKLQQRRSLAPKGSPIYESQ